MDRSTEKGAALPSLEETVAVHLNPDEQFFVDHKDELLKAYEGRFVAIRDCMVVADAATRRELEEILAQKYGEPVYAMVRRVTEGAFEFGPENSILIS